MPNYSYTCRQCNQRFTETLSYEDYERAEVRCPHCGSDQIQRLIGRVRFARSGESRLDNLSDPAALEGIEDDPRAMARMLRQMGSEMGEEARPEFDEVVNRLEAGQSPEEIEKDLPELGEGMGDF